MKNVRQILISSFHAGFAVKGAGPTHHISICFLKFTESPRWRCHGIGDLSMYIWEQSGFCLRNRIPQHIAERLKRPIRRDASKPQVPYDLPFTQIVNGYTTSRALKSRRISTDRPILTSASLCEEKVRTSQIPVFALNCRQQAVKSARTVCLKANSRRDHHRILSRDQL